MVFEINPKRGFLPNEDPLQSLPKDWEWLDNLGSQLPNLVKDNNMRAELDSLSPVSTITLQGCQIDRARMIYSFLASAYVWAPNQLPVSRIPKGIAVPLYELSRRVGRPPIMSYWDYCLYNWKRKDPSGPIAFDNLELLQKFNGIPDEAGFILNHTEIERENGPGLAAISMAQLAVKDESAGDVRRCLNVMTSSIRNGLETIKLMNIGCNPDVYYRLVRPYIFGFKNVVFEGVSCWHGKPRTLRGETGAQSSIVPSYVAALGIKHETTDLIKHLQVMQYYMPPEHRKFTQRVKNGPSIRKFVLKNAHTNCLLKLWYNECVMALYDFRAQHFKWAKTYIYERVENPEGTGGTIFMKWLDQLCDETIAHLIP